MLNPISETDRPSRCRRPRRPTFLLISMLVLAGLVAWLGLLRPGLLRPGPAQQAEAGSRPDGNQVVVDRTHLVDSFGGMPSQVAISGSLAYAAIGSRLLPIDISDPDDPTTLHRGWQLAGVASDIILRDRVAWVLHKNGFQWIDLDDPDAPCCDMVGRADSMAIAGDHGYFLSNVADPLGAFLGTMRLETPPRTEPEGSEAIQGYDCRIPTAAAGRLFFQCYYPRGIQVYSLADPADPELIGAIPTADRFSALLARDELLFGLTTDRFSVLDVRRPLSPTLLAEIAIDRGIEMRADGDRLVVLGGDGSLHVLDIADPAAPSLLGSLAIGRPNHSVLGLDEGRVALADSEGLRLVELSAGDAPVERGGLPGQTAIDSAATSDTVYVVTGKRSLAILDRGGGARLQPVREIDLTASIDRILVSGRYAYLSGEDAGQPLLLALDLEQGMLPVEIGRLQLDHPILHLAPAGDDLLLAGSSGEIAIVDVADPSRPRVRIHQPLEHRLAGLDGVPGAAYVSESAFPGPKQLRTFDLSDPDAPVTSSRLDFAQISGLDAEGDRIYLLAQPPDESPDAHPPAAEAGGTGPRPLSAATAPPPTELRLMLLDASVPARPSLEGSLTLSGGWPWPTHLDDVVAEGQRAYVQFQWANTNWYRSVATFFDDQMTNRVALPSSSVGRMSAEGDSLFVAQGEAGLVELRAGPVELSPTPSPEPSHTPTATSTATTSPTNSSPTITPTSTPSGTILPPASRLFIPSLLRDS